MYHEENDLFRIKDIIDALSDSQIEGKKWLVNELIKLKPESKGIFIAGGWYGQLAALLSDYYDCLIISADLDTDSKNIGHKLLNGLDINVEFAVDDAATFFMEKRKIIDILINTSCEHMEQDDVKDLITYKQPDTLVAFQSNNYYDVLSHINCSDSLDDFVNYLELDEILYKGVLSFDDYERYMVIGR